MHGLIFGGARFLFLVELSQECRVVALTRLPAPAGRGRAASSCQDGEPTLVSTIPEREEPRPVEKCSQRPVNYLDKSGFVSPPNCHKMPDLPMDSIGRGCEMAVGGGEGQSVVEGGGDPH